MALTKQDILFRNDAKVIEIEVPEWQGTVFIRQLSARAREQIAKLVDQSDLQTKAITFALCDADGNLLFNQEDVEQLATHNGYVIDKLFTEIMAHNGIGKKELDDAKKN